MMPSRDFLVRQSVLNAVQKCWPSSTKLYGVSRTLDIMGCGHSPVFVDACILPFITREFRKLVLKFDSAMAVSCNTCFGTGRAPMPHSDIGTMTCECVEAHHGDGEASYCK